ncbi:MAG TPA: trypsin-like peptidase domain-containing protein [Gaiellaceae bacterium]|nr:trypsin-like peptidase domain-containing protein [Gaiellaceae bacterium]
MNHRSPRFVYVAVAAALAIGVGAGFAAHSLTSSTSASPAITFGTAPTTPVSSSSTSDSLTQIYAKDAPGVVTVTVSGRSASAGSNNPFGLPGQQQFEAIGTGFEIDSKGNILTAEHVVAGASTIKVTFQNGSTTRATLVGSDSSTDSAVIHVDVPAAQLHPLTLGNSSSVIPGQAVVAIGTPLSPSYSESMSAGIVSAINRTITAPNGFSIPGSIQTDAAINHGNSGGPLIDVATNTVIGINDQIPAGTVNANVGIGFAAPIDSAKSSAFTIIAGGTVEHAYMGVRIGDAPTGGAEIGQIVAGSPAAKAGLKRGDVITAYNGKSIVNADALTAAVTQSRVNEKVTLTIRRAGATKHLTLTLGVQPSAAK